MIPDAYDLKRIVRAHRARFWLPDLLEGFEFAPVWRFADQAQFDSDVVDALARRLAAGPQRLPHPETIFELADRSRTIRSQIVYARQREDGIEAVWLALWRSPRCQPAPKRDPLSAPKRDPSDLGSAPEDSGGARSSSCRAFIQVC